MSQGFAPHDLSHKERQQVRRAFERISEQGWGLALGLLLALTLFLATVILVVRGGPNPGAHLSLLRVYFPGYGISLPGAVIGACYAFFLGYGAGRTIATVYNRFVTRQ
jgi:hypothetical protein